MAINFSFGGDNEYIADAEQARRQAEGNRAAGGLAGASPIAVVLDLLGIGRQVAKPPKGESGQTGDLASTPESPDSVPVAVTDKKGNVLDVVEQTLRQVGESTDVQRLPLAPLELGPLPQLSGRGSPQPLQRIDPTTNLPR